MFEEITDEIIPMSTLNMLNKLKYYKELYGNINVQFDFGGYPTTITHSDSPNEFFINFGNSESSINRLLNQLEEIEDDFKYYNFSHEEMNNEVLVGREDENNFYRNHPIIEINLEDNHLVLITQENLELSIFNI